MEEAEEFLEDCMAQIVDDIRAVREYFEENGADIAGLNDDELETLEEVFLLPSGQYLIVEG